MLSCKLCNKTLKKILFESARRNTNIKQEKRKNWGHSCKLCNKNFKQELSLKQYEINKHIEKKKMN